MYPGMIRLHTGTSRVAGTQYPIDWLGKGRRKLSVICPKKLDEIKKVNVIEHTLDSSYFPADTSHFYPEPERYYLNVTARIQRVFL